MTHGTGDHRTPGTLSRVLWDRVTHSRSRRTSCLPPRVQRTSYPHHTTYTTEGYRKLHNVPGLDRLLPNVPELDRIAPNVPRLDRTLPNVSGVVICYSLKCRSTIWNPSNDSRHYLHKYGTFTLIRHLVPVKGGLSTKWLGGKRDDRV